MAVERVPGKDGFADNLIVRNRAAGEGPGILILSHIDTVHPIGTLNGALPFRRDGDRLYGPGLFDMKGGAYLALEAFRQVAKAKCAKLPVTYLFTPDEEVGSPTSRALIEAEAKTRALCAGHRAGRDGGKIVTARKGVGRFEVKTIGVPAHSGARHQDGRSAIKEMARQVLAIEEHDRLRARRDHDGRHDLAAAPRRTSSRSIATSRSTCACATSRRARSSRRRFSGSSRSIRA